MTLSLTEEVVLLTLDEAGRPIGRQGLAAGLALAGAAVMELALAGRVDTDRHRLLRESAAPTGDPALDLALPLLEEAPDSRGALLLLIPTRRWVKAQDRPEPAEVLARLHHALEGGHIPEPREALLVALARAAGLLPLLLPAALLETRQSRLAWLAGLEALGRSLGEVVADLRVSRLAG